MQCFSGTTLSPCETRWEDFVEEERELCLRIFRMDQERRAAVNIAAQQAQAFVGGVPRLHHDVVQLLAQEVVHHVLVAVLHFQEVGQHADRRQAIFHRARSEQPAHRLGGIAVLGDDRLQRALLAHGAGVFGAQGIQMPLAFGLGSALRFQVLADLG